MAPFVFAFIAIPLGIVIEKSAKAISFGLSLFIIFAYYLLLIVSLNLGEKGALKPAVILWFPNIILFLAGIFFWRKMLRK